MERTFFFLGFCPKRYSGSVAGRNAIRTRQSKTIFAEGKGFALPRLFFQNGWIWISAAQEGAGGMRGEFVFVFLAG